MICFRFLLLFSFLAFLVAENQIVCNCPIDVMLVLDSSGSISDVDMEHYRNFGRNFVDRFNIAPLGANMGLVNFAESSSLEMCLTGTPCALRIALDKLQRRTEEVTTYIPAGLGAARSEFNLHGRVASNSKRLLILVSDGDNTSPRMPKNQSEEIAFQEAVGCTNGTIKTDIFVVAVGSNIQEDFLKRLVALSPAGSKAISDHFIKIDNYSLLVDKVSTIVGLSCYYTFQGSCAHTSWLLSLLLLVHSAHVIILLWKRPRVEGKRKIGTVDYIVISVFGALLFLLSIIMAASSDDAVRSGLCGAIIAFAVLDLLATALALFIIWFRNWNPDEIPQADVPAKPGQRGISAAGLSTLAAGGSTPAAMTGFRQDSDKIQTSAPEMTQVVGGGKRGPPPRPNKEADATQA